MSEEKMTPQEMHHFIRMLGKMVASELPPGLGFALLVFDFGNGGNMQYVSNGLRGDMIKALKECIQHLESDNN